MPDQPSPAKPLAVVHDRMPVPDGLKGAVVALGNFDGVHRGHRAVIGTAQARARTLGAPAAVLTFEPPPRAFFLPGEPLFRLSDPVNKLRLLAATGLDAAMVMDFDGDLAGLTAEEFVRRVLVGRFAVAGAVMGFNFHFGKNRAGSPDFLVAEGARLGFAVDVVPPLEHDGQRVSSGAVRAALAAGEVGQATSLLGYPWFVSGEVVHGDKRGRELGYPTANIRLPPDCALRHGIYAVRVGVGDKRLDAIASFGRRPMFDTGVTLLEVFLFDFSGDLYGARLDVAFLGWIREEMHFDSIAALVRQMDEDSRVARIILDRSPHAFPPLGPLATA
jgi:riboflavin kinase/FMN adenylyltransferase